MSDRTPRAYDINLEYEQIDAIFLARLKEVFLSTEEDIRQPIGNPTEDEVKERRDVLTAINVLLPWMGGKRMKITV